MNALAGALLLTAGITAFAGSGLQPPAQPNHPVQSAPQGIPYDWSHHHLIFSRPLTAAKAALLEKEPRYPMQQAWRSRPALSSEGYMQAMDAKALQLATSRALPILARGKRVPHHKPASSLHRDWTMFMGGSPSNSHGVTNMYPAKYTFSTSGQSCSDFVVFSTEQRPSSGQASIVGFNNLYRKTSTGGCSGTVPTVSWAFDTSNADTNPITTSVVLSISGTKIAFVEGSHLVLIKLPTSGASGTLTNPTTLTNPAPPSFPGCTAPCMTSIALTNSDNFSSSFYDYSHDTLYVGDSGNILYQFTGVFSGTPAKAGSPWPVTVTGATGGLSSPVYDSTSTLVFVSDITGGFLYSVSSTSPSTQVKSARLSTNTIFNDAPIVDSNAEKVYYFSSDDGASPAHSGVFQLPATFTNGSSGMERTTGAPSTNNFVYDGDFDNTFYNSSTGHLYACGNPGASPDPSLYQIAITSGVMTSGAASPGPTLTATNNINCSPITEFFGNNGSSQDLIFLSVTDQGSLGNCNGHGCIMSFDVTTASSFTSTSVPASSVAQSGTGGTTGIVIDNNTTNSGGSQLYFQPLSSQSCMGNGGSGAVNAVGNGACATQAAQSNLSE